MDFFRIFIPLHVVRQTVRLKHAREAGLGFGSPRRQLVAVIALIDLYHPNRRSKVLFCRTYLLEQLTLPFLLQRIHMLILPLGGGGVIAESVLVFFLRCI